MAKWKEPKSFQGHLLNINECCHCLQKMEANHLLLKQLRHEDHTHCTITTNSCFTIWHLPGGWLQWRCFGLSAGPSGWTVNKPTFRGPSLPPSSGLWRGWGSRTGTYMTDWIPSHATLLGYPEVDFPCFSSVIRQMPGYKWKGARPAYTRSWRLSAKESPILGSNPRHPSNQRTIASWDHLPPVLTCQGLQPRHHTVSVSTSPVMVYKDPFPISRNASWTQEWFNLARDDA
jgi:hypothetical protein